ncbi:involucrin-like [Heptranchias perlo]|uniref:involucrin-like n=1 Tax=Heptranchias perlo TaxID=212740 RepID=UPI00355AAAE3
MKIAPRHKYQAEVTEGDWLPEQLEELQLFGKQCQQLQHSDNQAQRPDQEWPCPQGQWADYQVKHPDPELQSAQSQWLDHQACGDQQLQCPQVQHLEDQAYKADDDWPCPQGEWFSLQAHHPDQEVQHLQGQWLDHQPHCSQQELQPQQGQWLDCLVHYPDEELQPQHDQWPHYQGDHLGQQWQYSRDQQPDLESCHSDQGLQSQQEQSTHYLQGGDQHLDHRLDQQEENQTPDHQVHCSDQRDQESNLQSDLDEEQPEEQFNRQVHQPDQQQQLSQQADYQSPRLDQMCQGQMPDPQATYLGVEQQGQRAEHPKRDVDRVAQLSKPQLQHLDHQQDRPSGKTQQQAKLPPRAHVCRRSRHHQTRAHCSQPKLPKEHLLRLSVKLGEHLPSAPQNKQKPPCEKEPPVTVQTRQHRKKRASHRSASERHPYSGDENGTRENRLEKLLINKEMEQQWETFKTVINSVQEKYTSLNSKNKLASNDTPQTIKEIRAKLKLKKKANIKYIDNKGEDDKWEYGKVRKEVKKNWEGKAKLQD